jgi:hypothetical protein
MHDTEDEELQGKDSQFDSSDPLVAAVYIPGIGPRIIGRFPTEAEARSAEVAFCERDAEHHRQYRERCDRENARRTVELAKRIRARKLEARHRFQRSRASVVVLDRITYHRDEFSVAKPGNAAIVGIAFHRGKSREAGGSARRSSSSRRGPPSRSGSDDDENDPPGSPEHRLARPSSTDGGGR